MRLRGSTSGIELLHRINSIVSSTQRSFKNCELDQLTDYITVTHHGYIKKNVEPIIDLSQHLMSLQEKGYSEFNELPQTILLFIHQLMDHLKKEESVLFPKINQLIAKKRNPKLTMGVPVGFIKNGILKMQMEHEVSFDFMKFLHRRTNHYNLPCVDIQLYYCLFEKMKDFEENLFIHMQLENCILFPKATALEDELAKKL